MLKTISAALLAVSVFAAPSFAGGYCKTTQAPTIRDWHVNSTVLSAYCWMGRDHHKHYLHHHPHHQHIRHYQHHHH